MGGGIVTRSAEQIRQDLLQRAELIRQLEQRGCTVRIDKPKPRPRSPEQQLDKGQRATTACDGPGCSAEHTEGEHVVATGWLSVTATIDEHQGDFCSVGCLATWAMALATDLGTGGKRQWDHETIS